MRLLLILIFFGASVCRGDDNDTKSWQHPEPITYESLIKWHQEGGLKKYIWPKELNADLAGDGHNEVFLGISGYGRGMVYALFTNTRNG